MDNELLYLNMLFSFVIVMSFILICVSLASLGKQLGDIEYQVTMCINGIRRLQSNVNVRKHVGRVIIGFVFFSVSFVSFTDISLTWRMWISRIEFLFLLLYMTYATIADWLDEYQQLKILMHTTPTKGLSEIRLVIHAINNNLQEVYGINDELQVKYGALDVLTRQLEIHEKIAAQIVMLQKMIRMRDPAYKFEKYSRDVEGD